MYQALYRKYRPQTFDDVVGQAAVTQTLKNQLTSGKLSHAYLFTGSRGTGKTSCAKILAKAVNCLNPQNGNPCNCCEACKAIDSGSCMDVLEIDAASNNGVDNVRDLRDDAIYSPSQVKMRVYIIDEVHMLSVSAFNALLKIIEEPPEHLLFILATTELHKVPVTILSRCQRFSFRRIGQEEIAARLQYVAYQENIDMDAEAARILARMADGALRDGLGLLDQCASATAGELTAQRIYACLGLAGQQKCGELLGYIARQDSKGAMELFDRLYADGKDLAALLDEMACLCRDLLMMKTAPKAGITMLSGVAPESEIASLSKELSGGELLRILEQVEQTLNAFSRSASRRLDAELCILSLCRPELQLDAQALNARLTRVEEQLQTGNFTAPLPASQPVVTAEQPKPQPTPEQPEPPKPEPVTAEFWPELVAMLKQELKMPEVGFFQTGPNAPVKGTMEGGKLFLRCDNAFILGMVNTPETLAAVGRKATILLKQPISAVAVDASKLGQSSAKLDQLLAFGKAHSDIIHIQD